MARQVLGAAAAIGRSFDFDTVLAASGRSDEEAVGALEELVEHGLVREAGPAEASYEFSHQKLRELVYEETSPPRRRLLHRRIAASLPRRGETAALTGQQLRLAGESARRPPSSFGSPPSTRHRCSPMRTPSFTWRWPWRSGPGRHGRHSRADRRPTHPRGRLRRRARKLRERRGRERGIGARGARAEAGRRPRSPGRLGALRGAADSGPRRGAAG